VPDAPALLFACRRLIDELGGFLLARQAGVQRLDWCLGHADGAPTRFELGSAAPARDPRHWLELLRERLDRLSLPAPVRDIRLDSEHLRPLAPGQGELFPLDAAAAAPDPALLDRLRARLGREAVHGIETVADQRPEYAWRTREPVLASPAARGRSSLAGASGGAAMLGVRSDRPLWLLQAPQPLGRDGNRPWLDGPLALGAGCERIDTGWWDGQPVARDYYVAVTSEGERLWIYRDLRGAGGWFVHGIFGSRSRGPG
jgi:protein ImuB